MFGAELFFDGDPQRRIRTGEIRITDCQRLEAGRATSILAAQKGSHQESS